MGTKETAKVCLYDDHLAGAFHEFCRTIWPGSSSGTVKTPSAVSGSATPPTGQQASGAPTFLFLKDEKVVGHVATIPVRLSTASGVTLAHWIVGFMVLPEYRSGLVGPLLIKEVNRVLDFAMSLHVEPPVLRILTGLKWVHKGVLPQYLCVLRGAGVLGNLQPSVTEAVHSGKGQASALRALLMNRAVRWMGGSILATGQWIWRTATGLARNGPIKADVRREETFDDSYTALWQSVCKHFGASLARDRAALQARFGAKMERYRLLACRRDKELLGYCIVKLKRFWNDPRMGNMNVGTIVDCLYDPRHPAILQTLLAEAFQSFRQEGAHVVLCTASFKPIRELLLRNGFFRIPGNLNFAYHNRSSPGLEAIPLEAWHLMRGDSDADQNF